MDIFSHFHRNAKKISAAGFVCADFVFHFVLFCVCVCAFQHICFLAFAIHITLRRERKKNTHSYTHTFPQNISFSLEFFYIFFFLGWEVKFGENAKKKTKENNFHREKVLRLNRRKHWSTHRPIYICYCGHQQFFECMDSALFSILCQVFCFLQHRRFRFCLERSASTNSYCMKKYDVQPKKIKQYSTMKNYVRLFFSIAVFFFLVWVGELK